MDAKAPLAPPILETNRSRPPWMSGTMAVVEDGWTGALADDSLADDTPANGTLLIGRPDADLAEFPAGRSDAQIASFIDELADRVAGPQRRRGVPPPIKRR